MKIQYALVTLLLLTQLTACSNEPKKSAVVAKSDLEKGYDITADQVTQGDVEVSKIPASPLESTSEANGVANRDIKAGEALSKSDIVFPPTSLFATRDLPQATELVVTDVEVKTLSKGGHESDVFVPSKKGVVGRTMRREIKAGQPIFENDLGPKVMFH